MRSVSINFAYNVTITYLVDFICYGVIKVIDFIVRYAAFISITGLITGFNSNEPASVLIELGMIIIWIHSDMHHLKRLYRKFK